MTRLNIPELKPEPEDEHPGPDQLDTGELEPVDQRVIEGGEAGQEHVAAAQRRAHPLQARTLQDAAAAEARDQVRRTPCSPSALSTFTTSAVAMP